MLLENTSLRSNPKIIQRPLENLIFKNCGPTCSNKKKDELKQLVHPGYLLKLNN